MVAININYNIIFSLPTNSKNCIKRVAFIQKYTHKIILNLQELWPRTVFTFHNGKGCVGGGKSVLKINSMTWKINRQKKICLGSPTRWTRYFGFDVRLPLVFNKVQQFWMALHSFGCTIYCVLYIVQGWIFRFAEYSLQPQEKSLIVLLELQVERVVFMPNKGKSFFIGSLQLL